jgi:hypothetical protein
MTRPKFNPLTEFERQSLENQRTIMRTLATGTGADMQNLKRALFATENLLLYTARREAEAREGPAFKPCDGCGGPDYCTSRGYCGRAGKVDAAWYDDPPIGSRG